MGELLWEGDSGPEVRLLQRLLRDLTYYPGRIDGDFGPATRAAVAAYQSDHWLSHVEAGVCDDEVWASLESNFGPLEGLRSKASIDEYVSDTYGVMNTGMTPEDRLAALEAEVNQELAEVGVPYVHLVSDPDTPRFAAFDPSSWIATINPGVPQNDDGSELGQEEQALAVGSIYHEARHAEQWFGIARLLAGLHGRTAEQIRAETDIPESVAAAAVAYPILERTRGNGPAWDWYESHFGTGKDDRAAIYGRRDAASENDPDYWPAYGAYRSDLPEESDAWDGDGALARRWREEAAGGAPVAVRPVLRRGDYNSAEVRYLQQLLAYRPATWEALIP